MAHTFRSISTTVFMVDWPWKISHEQQTARSSDLTPFDFFALGFVKSEEEEELMNHRNHNIGSKSHMNCLKREIIDRFKMCRDTI